MITHSTFPPTEASNARAIAGKLMLTIEEWSDVTTVPAINSASTGSCDPASGGACPPEAGGGMFAWAA
ncbi:MAG TPA: hypothetical protein VFI22_14540 [Thermomicrobiales bacterium]|nr:hypothetical protein [Thermomicrobiales bacterium]